MKNWLLVAVLWLTGCTHIDNYQRAQQIDAPLKLQGVWQTIGPQKGLISPEARATLIIDKKGDTLDCREWQRVMTKSGKLIWVNHQIENLNQALRHRPLVLKGHVLHYDRLKLHRTQHLSQACQSAVQRSINDKNQFK